MSKRKHLPEWIFARIEEYLPSQESYEIIAQANGISAWTLRQWVENIASKVNLRTLHELVIRITARNSSCSV